jgi:hypothetical protein
LGEASLIGKNPREIAGSSRFIQGSIRASFRLPDHIVFL